MPDHRNPGPILAVCYESLGVEVPRPLVKLGLVGLFNSHPLTVRTHDAVRLPMGRFNHLLYIVECSDRDFHFICSSQPLMLSLPRPRCCDM
jgi:hypothetical protein